MDLDKELAVSRAVALIIEQMESAKIDGEKGPSADQSIYMMGYIRGYTEFIAKYQFLDEAGADILLFVKVHEALAAGAVDFAALVQAADSLSADTRFIQAAQLGAGDAAAWLSGKAPVKGLRRLLG